MSEGKIDSAEHEEWNERMAQRYSPDAFINKTGFIVRFVQASRLRKSAQLLRCNSTSKILDVGCGSGNLLKMLEGQRLVGVDLSPSLLAVARERLAAKKNVELVRHNIEKLPFADNSFDRVVCSEVLEHCAKPQNVMNEMVRVCMDNGIILITVPNEDLINFSKRITLKFGLKKFIAGDYPMSDNMLEEWHLSEITPEWVRANAPRELVLIKTDSAPFSFIPYHRMFSFIIKKK